LGAPRGRLIGQMLAESVLLAVGGGALGVLVAKLRLSGISRIATLHLPRTGEIRLDGMVLGFAVAISMATGLVSGLIPSPRASRPATAAALRASGEAASPHARRLLPWFQARGILVVGQVALSMILLIGAALLVESLARIHRVDPGFNVSHLL